LDLTTEPLYIINQRYTKSSIPITPTRSASFTLITPKKSDLSSSQISPSIDHNTHQQPILNNNRLSTNNSRYQPNINTQKSPIIVERGRTFVHHSDSRPFILSAAIQMKPIDDHDKRRPCHRQNALRYKLNEQERQPRLPTINISRYQSIERRITPSPQPMNSFSFDIHDELPSSDISWSVREKAKLFEHKLSTGRENYV
jgi:hypothetical protein